MFPFSNNKVNERIILKCFQQRFNEPVDTLKVQAIGGGCINETFKITINSNLDFFIKQNKLTLYPRLLASELIGLKFLQIHQPEIIPGIIGFNEQDDTQLLMLQWIETGIPDKKFWQNAGASLAALHQVSNQSFGFAENNYIGSLPQSNQEEPDWIKFFIQQRLIPQLEIARANNAIPNATLQLFEKLFIQLPGIFPDEPPALLHGDLWNGNIMCDKKSQPFLIDPSIYYGNRLMDIGMSRLFGGFEKPFYEAYHYHYPLQKDYQLQSDVCNLYPLLVHVNLFGGQYLHQVQSILNKLV